MRSELLAGPSVQTILERRKLMNFLKCLALRILFVFLRPSQTMYVYTINFFFSIIYRSFFFFDTFAERIEWEPLVIGGHE